MDRSRTPSSPSLNPMNRVVETVATTFFRIDRLIERKNTRACLSNSNTSQLKPWKVVKRWTRSGAKRISMGIEL